MTRLDGFDYIIVGLILGVGGALLLAKAYLMPSFPVESAMGFMGANPFVIRNAITTRHEAVAGSAWIVVGLLVSLIGTVRTARGSRPGYLVSFWLDIVVVLAAALVVWRLTLVVTERTARREYLPVMISNQREVYARDVYVVFHDGRYRTDPANMPLDDSIKEQRWKSAREAFDRLAKLLDEPRREGESDQAYATRIATYFPGISF